MQLISNIREAALNLWGAKLRSFLAILGVLVGTSSVVALISSSQLATTHALAQFKTLGTDLISVYFHKNPLFEKTKQIRQFSSSDISVLYNAIPDIQLIAPYVSIYQSMHDGAIPLYGQIIGATQSLANIAKIEMQAGRFVSFLDQDKFFCVIGEKFAEKISKHGKSSLYQQINVGDQIFTVIGIMKKWPLNLFISADLNNSIIIPLNTSFFLSKNANIDNLIIRFKPHSNIELNKQLIIDELKKLLPQQDAITSSPEQLIHLIAKSRETYTWLLIAIGSISLIVGGIGVMNIMLVSVVERRKEIGIRMAIGARQMDVLRMFLIESIMLTLFGGALGVIIGVVSSWMITVMTGWEFYFYLLPVGLGFLVSIIVGILSGFYPAWRASRLDPIQTLTSD